MRPLIKTLTYALSLALAATFAANAGDAVSNGASLGVLSLQAPATDAASDALLPRLRSLRPAVIALRGASLAPTTVDRAQALADALGYQYRFVSTAPAAAATARGLAILTRLPIVTESGPAWTAERYLRLIDGDRLVALYGIADGADPAALARLIGDTGQGAPVVVVGAAVVSDQPLALRGTEQVHAARAAFAAPRSQPVALAGDATAMLVELDYAPPKHGPHAWSDPSLSPDRRAELVLAAMTQDEKFQLLTSAFGLGVNGGQRPAGALGSAGFVAAIKRLGIPAQQIVDAGLGVTNPADIRKNDIATAMPSGPLTASTWNRELAFESGQVMGREAWREGMNVLLAGAASLQRDPRNGRNFEYAGEDPLLSGVLVGESVKGVQSQHVVSTMKHYAMNDLETGRNSHNAVIGERALRESDLLAFELLLETGRPGAVMCAYPRVNGEYACENAFLMNQVLRKDWHFPGYVMSDWGGVHSSAKAALAGLDQQSAGEVFDKQVFFDQPLRAALAAGEVSQAQIDTMARRILRTMFAYGLVDRPPHIQPIDGVAGQQAAQRQAEQGVVLLRNEGAVLPIGKQVKRIVVIGGHADVGVIAGGGSSLVAYTVAGPNAVPGLAPTGWPGPVMYQPSSPLQALRRQLPGVQVDFVDGTDLARAAKAAAAADMALVFATQWSAESVDLPDMTLPDGQDALIQRVATANPKTVVVLETNAAVKLPWLKEVPGLLEAWYPGIGGGEAIAGVLTGRVNPSGRLPSTWPFDESQLPRPSIPGLGFKPKAQPGDSVDYTIEGANVGYKWFAAKGLKPLFPFGHGLSYSHFSYSDYRLVAAGRRLVASFTVRNDGAVAGADVPQLYVKLPGGRDTPIRLAGWQKLELRPGESRAVRIEVEPRTLADYDPVTRHWRIPAGIYTLQLGHSATEVAAAATVSLSDSEL